MTTQPGERILWLDALRGATILLVVFHHAWLTAWTWLGDQADRVPWYVYTADTGLSLARIPAFFLCSGILFAGPMTRGWGWFVRHRLAFAIWVIFIWTLLSNASVLLGLPLYPWSSDPYKVDWSLFLWNPHGNLWFIYAIAILGTLAMILRPLPRGTQLGIALMLAIFLTLVIPYLNPPGGLGSLMDNLGTRGVLLFMLGVLFSERIRTGFRTHHLGALVALSVWGGAVAMAKLGWLNHPVAEIIPTLTSTFAAIYLLQYLLARLTFVARVLAPIGRRSLDVFLLHQFGIALSFLLLVASGIAPLWWVGLPFVFLGSVGFSMAVSPLLRRVPGNPFFGVPRSSREARPGVSLQPKSP